MARRGYKPGGGRVSIEITQERDGRFVVGYKPGGGRVSAKKKVAKKATKKKKAAKKK